MNETQKYLSKLYNTSKPLHAMTIQELCDHCKICKSIDKTSLKKILRMEKWDKIKLEKKKNKFLNKIKMKNKTRKMMIKNKKTKRQKNINNNKTKTKRKTKIRKTKKEITI